MVMQAHELQQDVCARLMEADPRMVEACCDEASEEETSDTPKMLVLMTTFFELACFIEKHLDASKLTVGRFSMNSDGSLKEKSANILEAFETCGSKAAEMIKKLREKRALVLGPCSLNPPADDEEEDFCFCVQGSRR